MRRAWLLALALARIEARLYRRNPLELLGITVILGGGLLLAFFGARHFIPAIGRSGPNQTAFVITSVVYAMTIFGVQGVAQGIQQAAQAGTLEQMAMSPLGLPRVVIVNYCVVLVGQCLATVPMSLVLVGGSGRLPAADPLGLVAGLVALLAGLLGLALMLGGLSVVFKRMNIILGSISVPMLALIALPLDKMPYLSVFPVVLPADLLRRTAAYGLHLWQVPPVELAATALNAALYLAAGVLVFRWMDRTARKRGVLGQY